MSALCKAGNRSWQQVLLTLAALLQFGYGKGGLLWWTVVFVVLLNIVPQT